MPNPNHKMYKSGGVTVVEDLEENELRIYEDNDGYLHVRLDSDLAKFILKTLAVIDRVISATAIDKPVFAPVAPEVPDAPADGI
jgi:hypothetical protein